MFEVPTHKDVHLSNSRNGNVLSVCDHARRQRSLPHILFGEPGRFAIQRYILYVGRGYISQNSLHLIWCPYQLSNHHVRDYQDRLSGIKPLHESSRGPLELIVSTSTDHGGVDVNTESLTAHA